MDKFGVQSVKGKVHGLGDDVGRESEAMVQWITFGLKIMGWVFGLDRSARLD